MSRGGGVVPAHQHVSGGHVLNLVKVLARATPPAGAGHEGHVVRPDAWPDAGSCGSGHGQATPARREQ